VRAGQRTIRMVFCACAAAMVVVLVAGWSAGLAARDHHGAVGVIRFWIRARLLRARPLVLTPHQHVLLPGKSAASHTTRPRAALRVGALFEHDASGNHFCTASVVSSPGKDLLITAAHCINGGRGAGYKSDIVFIPGYRDGQEPFGVWTPARLLVAPQWAKSADPDFDVGFVILRPRDGRNIQQVLGANRLGIDSGYRYLVHVTGYPNSDNSPITCINWTSQQSATQLRFECSGYTGGTSGSPWVTRFNSRSRTGTIVGVIGGYQQGGDTPSVSYSVRLNGAVQWLYRQAVADEAASSQG
jgi:V8-like Glu-specific endopeptidase